MFILLTPCCSRFQAARASGRNELSPLDGAAKRETATVSRGRKTAGPAKFQPIGSLGSGSELERRHSRKGRVNATTDEILIFLAIAVLGSGALAQAQPATPCPCPPEEDKGLWIGSAGFGLTMNRGNTDTTNINLSFDATYDPKKRDVWKMPMLYLRGDTDGEATVDRLFMQGRYERALSARTFLFGQLQYLRDEFKEIDYLIAPTGGIGYKVVDTPELTFAVDAGAGVKWEKNPGLDVQTSATISAGDRLAWKVSPNATITQGFSALWDADDFGDALYTFSAGLAAGLVRQLELRIELLDTYSTRPPNPAVKKNDVAFLTSIVFKF